jgi:hypothetical protein
MLNAWFWRIVIENFVIGIFLIFLSTLLYLLAFQNIKKPLIISTLILSAIIFFYTLEKGFDSTILHSTPEEIFQINQRRSYYPKTLGKIFENRPILIAYKLQRNLFYNLDPNLYFYSNHPRERLGVNEFKKYQFFLLPFFILGAIYLIIKKNIPVTSYLIFSAFASAVLNPSYRSGPLLFFPFLNSVIAIGVLTIVTRIKSVINSNK